MVYMPCRFATPGCRLEVVDGAHWYRTPYGLHPSVTTVLSKTADKRYLEDWRRNEGEDVADYITETATAIGGYAHSLNEAYMARRFGFSPPERHGKDTYKLFANAHHVNFQPFLDTVKDVCALEHSVVSLRMNLAGTIDCVGTVDGERCIIDYKTKRSPPGGPHVHDHILQGTLYAMMWNEVLGDIYPVTRIIIAASIEYGMFETYTAPASKHSGEAISRVVMFHQKYTGIMSALPAETTG